MDESNHGVSWVAAYSMHTCHGLRPRGATRPGRCVSTGHGLVFRVDFHHFNSVVLSQVLISGLNPFNLSAYGLHACVLRLKYGITPVPPRISYPAAATLPGRDLHPQEYATLPSRTEIPFRFPFFACFGRAPRGARGLKLHHGAEKISVAWGRAPCRLNSGTRFPIIHEAMNVIPIPESAIGNMSRMALT